MKLSYVNFHHLPNQQAHAVQIFNTCSALAIEGIEVSCLAKHKGLKRGAQAAPGQWPLAASDYFDVQPNFTLVRPARVLWHALKRQATQDRFLAECDRFLARPMAQPDVVYTRQAAAAWYFARRDVPTVLEAHDLDIAQEPEMQLLLAQVSRGALPALRGVVAISQNLLDGLAELGIPTQLMTVARGGIDLSRFALPLTTAVARAQLRVRYPDAAELLGEHRAVVGYCGHFYEGRGLEMLLACAKRRPEWTFLLVGGFEDDVERCRHIATREQLHNAVFTGHVPNPDLTPYLWACDVLTMPYEYERPQSRFMSPMKMFESMATQRAIVSADWPQIREVLREGETALFHPRGDVDALEDALGRALVDAPLRQLLSANARREVEQYTWQGRARHLKSWLTSHLNTPSSLF